MAVLPSAKHVGLFISSDSLESRTPAQLARYDTIITNYDDADQIPSAKALNPAMKFLNYKNALLCNDWGREGPPPLPVDGHGVGTTGVSHTELVENPGWGLYEMLTEVYTNSVLRDLNPVFGPAIQNAFWTLDGAVGGPQVSISAWGSYTADLSAAGITLNQASICGNASLNSIDLTTNGIGTTFPLSASAKYTFEGWARLDALPPGGQFRCLFGSDSAGSHRIALVVRSDGFPSFYADTAVGAQTWFQEALVAGENFHWALTWDYTTREAEFFKNGASFGKVTLPGPMISPGNMVIGAWHSDKAHDVWDGKLSLVSVHPRILTEGRLTAHYINGPTTVPGGGALCESGLFPDNYLGDVGHSGYIERWISNVRLDIDGSDWDGIFMDDVDDTARFHFGVWIGVPGQPYTPMVDADLRERFDIFLSAVYDDLKSDTQVWANLANSGRPDVWERWSPWLHGAHREFWHKFGTGDSRPVTPSYPAGNNERFTTLDILFEDDFIPTMQAHGKSVIHTTYGIVGDTVMQLYGYAGVLLDVDSSLDTGYCYCKGDAIEDSWTTYWTKDIGHPVAPKVELAPGVYTREFTDGLVIFNGTDAPVAFNVGGWQIPGFTRLSTGGAVTSPITLQAATAEIISGARLVPNVRSKVSLPKKRGRVACRPEIVLE